MSSIFEILSDLNIGSECDITEEFDECRLWRNNSFINFIHRALKV